MRKHVARPFAATPAPRTRLSVEPLEDRSVPTAAPSAVPGELLVGFKPGVSQVEIGRFYAAHGLAEREALDRYAPATAAHLKLVAAPASRIAEVESDPRVAYAEPNYVYSHVTAAATPTDTLYVSQWHLNNTGQWGGTPGADIHATEAWKITTGSPDVLVAVLDGGVDYTHPDLAANIWTNPNEVPGDGVDNDGNGYADDVHGYDFVNNDADPMDDQSHGTAVAGIIGASPFNEVGAGVAWRVGIIPVKVVSAADTIKTSDAVKAFQYVNYLRAVEHLNIVATNNSYGVGQPGPGPSQALRDAMAGLDQPGMSPILHVCAAGNSNKNNDAFPDFPSGYDLDNIIAVAATDWNDHYADFSNYGAASVDLAAPGAAIILTTAPNGRYDFTFNGTSAAAPQVTGAAALVASAFPGLTAAQIKAKILGGADSIADPAKPTLTNGRLNIARALAGASPDNDHKPPAAVGSLAVAAAAFPSATLAWTAPGDDGSSGRASFYDLRYSSAPITSRTWDTATRALGEPGPRAAGGAESFPVFGLDPGATYYFALKVRDEMGNESDLSNVAAATVGPARTVFADDTEHGPNGWAATGLWHQSTLRSYSPATSWYYGQESTRTYDTEAVNAGTLTSPVIDLRHTTHPVLIYREWREVEDVTFADSARVQVGVGGNKWDTVSQSEFSTAVDPLNWQERAAPIGWNIRVDSPLSTPRWVSRAVDLSAYAGKTVQLRFAFDTVNSGFDDFEGWYVDDVNVYDALGTATAAGGSSVAGGEPMTVTPATSPAIGGATLATASDGSTWTGSGSAMWVGYAPPGHATDPMPVVPDAWVEQDRPSALLPQVEPGTAGAGITRERGPSEDRPGGGEPPGPSRDVFLAP